MVKFDYAGTSRGLKFCCAEQVHRLCANGGITPGNDVGPAPHVLWASSTCAIIAGYCHLNFMLCLWWESPGDHATLRGSRELLLRNSTNSDSVLSRVFKRSSASVCTNSARNTSRFCQSKRSSFHRTSYHCLREISEINLVREIARDIASSHSTFDTSATNYDIR